MKNQKQIREILERNIGITENKERINLKAIAELNNINDRNSEADLISMLRDLFSTGSFGISKLFSTTNFENPKFKTTLTAIDPRLAGLTRIEYSKDDVYVLLEGEEYTLSGDMVGIMMSRYNTVYAALEQETLKRLVNEFKATGIQLKKLEDLSVRSLVLSNIKTFLKSTKSIWVENYQKALISGDNPYVAGGTNGEEQWLDMKQNMLAAVYDGLYRMNVTFNLDLKDDLMDLLWDKDC